MAPCRRKPLWLRRSRSIPDPEIPVISIADLGILRDVEVDEDAQALVATITPTYSGCPAMEAITDRIGWEAEAHGYPRRGAHPAVPGVDDRLDDRGGPGGARALRHRAARAGARRRGPSARSSCQLQRHVVGCPHCGSDDTTEIAHFGSTACKALRRCNACLEPFDEFKAI